MVTGFVDTSVIVDFLRQYQPAIEWVQTQSDMGISSIAYMEVVSGAANKNDMQKAIKALSGFELVFLNSIDQKWAIDQHTDHALSHGIDMMDCLIASVSFRLQLPLYTRNLKHFAPLLETLAVQPY